MAGAAAPTPGTTIASTPSQRRGVRGHDHAAPAVTSAWPMLTMFAAP